MKIGYKGFDKDLKCKGYQFIVGEVATKAEKEKPRMCSEDGFHYCNKLSDVFEYYNRTSKHRFCEVEVLGNFTDDGNKSITTSLRVLKEIPQSEIFESLYEENMKLDLVKKLQTQYPLVHVGGSIGLYLHGIRLNRFKDVPADIDIIAPYFVLFDDFGDCQVDYIDGKASSNDFDQTFILDSVKVDCRIDPKQAYEVIEYKGFKYKVSKFEVILAAKVRYSEKNKKHRDDVREMCGVKEPELKKRSVTSDCFPF